MHWPTERGTTATQRSHNVTDTLYEVHTITLAMGADVNKVMGEKKATVVVEAHLHVGKLPLDIFFPFCPFCPFGAE